MSARDELAKLLFITDNHSPDAEHDWAHLQPHPKYLRGVYDMADATLAAGYSKPRTITTIGDLSGERAGTVILTAHGRIFEYTSRNWLAPGFMIDYQPIIDWLPATVLYTPKES